MIVSVQGNNQPSFPNRTRRLCGTSATRKYRHCGNLLETKAQARFQGLLESGPLMSQSLIQRRRKRKQNTLRAARRDVSILVTRALMMDLTRGNEYQIQKQSSTTMRCAPATDVCIKSTAYLRSASPLDAFELIHDKVNRQYKVNRQFRI